MSPGYILLQLAFHLCDIVFHLLLQTVGILTGVFLKLRQHLALLIFNGRKRILISGMIFLS